MTTYYVNKNHPSASDSNAGTSASLPWLTLSKATATVAAGDTVYIAGLYPELMTWATSGTSGSPIRWIFDRKGEYVGASYAGQHGITAHNDHTTTASRTACIDFNGKTFNEVYGGLFLGGTSFVVGNTAFATATAYEGVVIEDCTLQIGGGVRAIKIELNAGVTPTASGIQIKRNRIYGGIDFDWDTNGTANVNLKILIDGNIVFASPNGNTIDCTRTANGGSFSIGGFTLSNNTLFSCGSYCFYSTYVVNTTNPNYIIGNLLFYPGTTSINTSLGDSLATIVNRNIVVGCSSVSSGATEISPNYGDVPMVLGGLHDAGLFNSFGYSPYKPFEPYSITGYTNPAIDFGANVYAQTLDAMGQTRKMGRASYDGHHYYFDGSDAAATDPNSVWTAEENIIDASDSTGGTVTTTGDTSTNYVMAEGTNAPASGGTIAGVRVRVFHDTTSSSASGEVKIYSDGLAELLATVSVSSTSTDTYSSWTTLSTPSGGWTWAKVQALEFKAYRTSGAATWRIFKIEISVLASESTVDIGAVESNPGITKDTTTVIAGAASGSLAGGAGYEDYRVALSAGAHTITVKARYNATYSSVTLPSIETKGLVLLGTTEQIAYMTVAADTEETLTLSFTTTSAGEVTVRLRSYDTSASGGKATFDTLRGT